MVQHIEQHDIGEGAVRKGQRVRIAHGIKPRRRLNVGRDNVGCKGLEVAGAPADIERRAIGAFRRDALVEVAIDRAKRRLLLPRPAVGVEQALRHA